MHSFIILIVGPTPPPYHGVSVVTDMILNSELRDKFNLIHLDTSDRRSLSNIGQLDVRNIVLAVKHFFELILLLIRKHPEVVYIPICQTVIGFLRDAVFIFSSRLFGASIIIHLHGSYFRTLYERSNLFIKFIVRCTLKFVSFAIVLENCLRYIFEGLIQDEKIVVISNGIDKNYITNKELLRFRTYLNSNYKILFLSNLAREKGYIDVLHAIPDILEETKKIKFIFAGEFKGNKADEQHVSRFINQNRLRPFVYHAGIVTGETKRNLLLTSDIFVFPSYNEGQPIALIEAMASGLPIITTDTGVIREMVIDGENGFIIDKQSP